MNTAETPAVAKRRITIQEDWLVVALGFVIIFIFIMGFIVPAPAFGWKTQEELFGKVFNAVNILAVLTQGACAAAIALVASIALNKPLRDAMLTFLFVFVLTWLALIVGGNALMKEYNLESVIFSLLVGLLIGNLFSLPQWLRNNLSSEMFVKIGLVLLGTGIIFGDILKAGSLGLVQALIVVIAVWYAAFWICRRLGIDNELTMMICSAVSICGVSAAIATAGAIKGDAKKLSFVISLVLVTAIPMMILMPYAARLLELTEPVAGAWLGGTIDTTGAVVASGKLIGQQALEVSTIVKFSQNVLLGLAAFAISVYWTYTGNQGNVEKPSARLLWDRFPKFVLGFLVASLLFSFILEPAKVSVMKDGLKSMQNLWFVLAFTSIGLETRFSDLFHTGGKKPIFAFLAAQVFNILITLLIASLLFE